MPYDSSLVQKLLIIEFLRKKLLFFGRTDDRALIGKGQLFV